MAASTDRLELAAAFPAATSDEWRAMVAGVLRKSGIDGDPVEALTVESYDGIRIRPLYDGPVSRQSPALTRAAWDVRALHGDPDPARTRQAALDDLAGGATSLWLRLGGGGLPVAALPAALDGVYVELAPVALDAGAQTREAAHAFLDLARLSDVAGSLGADPIGLRARTGSPAELSLLGELAALARPYPGLRVATVDATVYHDAGASDADEVAVATAVAVAYLRALADAGVPVDEAFGLIEFRFAVTADQFLSIAKLRAARRVWGRVADLSDASDAAQYQHAVTSAAMMTRRDPWVNMLRTTIGCFAAAVGGADAITVLPFDAAIGLPDDFARRIARNTQAILHDESSLARVSDAAGGSGYVEALTESLAEAAWDGFTAIERAGGALAALDGGHVVARIAASRDARAADIAHRRFAITGVTEFALPDEAPLPRPPSPPQPSGGPLPAIRYAEAFESLRDAVEAADPRPSVYLATLGPLAAHSARVGFARNLFNVGGFRVEVGPVDAYDGTAIVCLCGRDEDYTAEAVAALAGASLIWLAGRVQLDGAAGTVYAGCDALAVLQRTLEVAQ